MTPQAILQLQAQLGLPTTGVLDTATVNAMTKAVSVSLEKNKDVQSYANGNSAESILNAYMTGDWSGVVDLSGKPFTKAQQKAAVSEAEKVLAPAFKAEQTYDTSRVADSLANDQRDFNSFQKTEADQFGRDKNVLDQNAADSGVLFSGARIQKQNDLRTSYSDREAGARGQVADRARNTARDYQYQYGDAAAGNLSRYYKLPEASTFNAGVTGGKVTPNKVLSSVYNPKEFNFQGTKPVAQSAAVQTRAASLLANRANKLALSGYGNKF